MRVVGEEHLDAVLARHPSFVLGHRGIAAPDCSARALLRAQATRPLRIGFLISPSVDGALGARIVRRLGGAVVRGSSSHTGAQAFKDYFNALIREKISTVINPDGPRGPRLPLQAERGAARAEVDRGHCCHSPTAPRARGSSPRTSSMLPLPFCRVAIADRRAARGARVLDAAGMERMQGEVERALHDAFHAARAALAEP